jgi:hypothetical protein
MKELVFLFIHFNNIQVHGIEFFADLRNQQTWPVLEAAWLRRPSERTKSFKVAVTKIIALRRLSRSSRRINTSSESSDIQLDNPEDEQAEQTEPQVYYFGG